MTSLMNIVLFGLGLGTASAEETAESSPGVTHGTAHVLDEGDWELGIYAPLRRGLGNGLELSIHPVTALLSPHLVAKKSWGERGDWAVATQHGLSVPTAMLRTLARPGIGGILPADAEIPLVVALDTRLLASRSLGEDSWVTLSARVTAAASFGDESWPTIDTAVAYTRTTVYQDHLATALGLQVDGPLVSRLAYRVDIDGWFLPLSEGSWAAETRGILAWRHSESFTVQVSGTAVVGEYPFGTDWHLLPGFDLIWSF